MSEPFHPRLPDRPRHARVHRVRASELVERTAPSGPIRAWEAVSGTSVGSSALWTGQAHVAAAAATPDHHHGESETSVYVVSGRPRFVFHDGEREVTLQTEPGDYVYVPPWVPHREENPDPERPAIVVISRTTQEPIMVELPALTPLDDETPAAAQDRPTDRRP